ncbi:hypothetical protein [Agrobacterium sp. Azo12]|uniref:hypothetical protein n=1 Tax=Agrobacterium sp. Azo12 TaxID=3031129 RepID=UPI0023D7C2B4|nr:hypothetical protein [Agrobacterium sp. Azo12]MDO5895715.1 hypothetical protein [Agrobacterium sp. Azo12]
MNILLEELNTNISALTSSLATAPRSLAREWFARHDFLGPASTNQDTHNLPFQRWYRFKEAFAPRAVIDAFSKLETVPRTCIDPFGGSGTTALTAQFLGIRPTTVEVNPFLADLIEAKLQSYNSQSLLASYNQILDVVSCSTTEPSTILANAPRTLIAPGVNGRWIYSAAVAERILAYRTAIEALNDPSHARLFKVLLGSTLVELSNVIISGKGRRYRAGWERRIVHPSQVGRALQTAFLNALEDVVRFGDRPCRDYSLLRGDARTALNEVTEVDFALFSPPYPNSFDYTDIYNLELWMLGYLKTADDNRRLRTATLRSHVQVKRSFDAVASSPILDRTMAHLSARRGEMWNKNIPDMVRAYFDDLVAILTALHGKITIGGSVMMVVGDSRYAGVSIDVGKILVELGGEIGFKLADLSSMRSMRSSAQQGGTYDLDETLVHLIKR